MSDRITTADLDRALTAHRDCLDACGITYEGRLGLDHGSATYGRAFRLYRTAYPYPCQERRDDHTDCPRCAGTGTETCSGHARPPIGDDYLGMTKREAYDELVHRTGLIYDTHRAITEGTTR